MSLRTAREWGVRPTVFLGHSTEEGGPWSVRDRELAKALLVYEASICDGCGLPSSETQDPDKEGWYETDTVICAGCQAVEKASQDTEPGERVRVYLDPNYVDRSAR